MHPDHWEEVDPARPAIVMGGTGEVVTYRELATRSRQLARVLRAGGLARGDHVALVLENHPCFFEVIWAALHSGLYVTPVNSHLTAEEIGYILGDSQAKAVISSAALARVMSQIDWSQHPELSLRLMVDGSTDRFESYTEALGVQPTDPLEDPSLGSLMLYTSGTTGRPKGVLRPLPEAGVNEPDPAVAGLRGVFGLSESSVYLSPAPLYHAAPIQFALGVLRIGGTVVVMKKFDATLALALIEKHRVTHSQWVPTMLIRLLALTEGEREQFDLSSHQVAVHAAAPCPVDVKRRMIEWWGPILVEYYAGTDSGGMTLIRSSEWLDHPGSVGRGNVCVIGEDGQELPPGEVGLVYFVGGREFVYKGDPQKTASSRLPGGLTTMGDYGYLDAEGWLYLTDRRDFTIISGGVNIYPREVEDVLISHPDVLDVGVFGIPSEEFGEEVKAVVQLVPETPPSERLAAQLVAFCREHLASYKCPRSIDFAAELPRTPAGKLLKRVLRDPFWNAEAPR